MNKQKLEKAVKEFDEYVKTATLAELLGLARDGYIHRKEYERFILTEKQLKEHTDEVPKKKLKEKVEP